MSPILGSLFIALIAAVQATTLVDTKLPGNSFMQFNMGSNLQYGSIQSQTSHNRQSQSIHSSSGSTNLHSSSSGSSSTDYDCTRYREYNDVMNIWADEPCTDAIKTIQLLADLKQHHSLHGHDCMVKAIGVMSNMTSTHNPSCSCSGNIYKHNYPYLQNDHTFSNCWSDQNFQRIFHVFYQTTDINHYQEHTHCMTHKHIWSALNSLRHTHLKDCRQGIIMHVDITYSNHRWRNFCKCHHVTATTSTSTSKRTTTTATTTMKTTTTTTTTTPKPPTTTKQPTTTPTTRHHRVSATHPTSTSPLAPTTVFSASFSVCPKLSTIQDIAQHNKASNTNASVCPSGAHSSPDAFVLNHCIVASHPSNWRQGLKVMGHCSTIPLYTPVATFFHGQYVPNGGNAGVFLGCLQNGFKLGAQPCDHDPIISHIETGGIFTGDPEVYYTIQ